MTLPHTPSLNISELLEIAKIESNIPEGSGLGSSAALSVALSRALNRKDLFDCAKKFEDHFHAGSSGIDVFTSLNGGLCKLHSKNQFEKLPADFLARLKKFKISIIYTGEHRKVREIKSKITQGDLEEFLPEAEAISTAFTEKLINDTLTLDDMTALFNRSQTALVKLKVSTPLIDDICSKLLGNFPRIGVKITGAGGGGCLLLVHDSSVTSSVISNTLNSINPNIKLYYDVEFLE